jgi:hypothetical protein
LDGVEEDGMIRCASLLAGFALSVSVAAAGESPLGTATQHEEWSRKFTGTGSTTRETVVDGQVIAGVAAPNACGQMPSYFEATSARHWQMEPCR